MTTKHTHCHFCEDQVRESGLLSAERMAEVSAAIDARIVPCCLPDGTVLKNAFVADHGEDGRFVYARCESPNQVEFMRRGCLPAVLTAAELDVINARCLEAREETVNKERFAKANKLNTWDGGAFLGDRYFATMDDLCDHLESEGDEWPEYVWSSTPTTVISGLDVADVIENQISDRGWEDMQTSDLNGVAQLQAALDVFVKSNEGVKSFFPDYKNAILLAGWKRAKE